VAFKLKTELGYPTYFWSEPIGVILRIQEIGTAIKYCNLVIPIVAHTFIIFPPLNKFATIPFLSRLFNEMTNS
jgi:hypothetical protein